MEALIKVPETAVVAAGVEDILKDEGFLPRVDARVKEIRESKRQGRDAKPREFKPSFFLRKLSELKAELETGEACAELTQGVDDVQTAFTLGVQFAIHADPISVAEQKAKDDERRRIQDEKKKAKAAERAKIKAEKLKKQQEEAAKLAEEIGASVPQTAEEVPAEAEAIA